MEVLRTIDVGAGGYDFYMISFHASGVSDTVPGDHALLDNVSITGLGFGCDADLDLDGAVDVDDLVQIITCWGPVLSGCESVDIAGPNGHVDVDDLVQILIDWGPCP